ncbi:PadR family transcriptional regulator [Microbacterium xanthum]|uniref:PadR family transcriptional regulator n=1 Tax=Microbacterium xanthum TaxID=3079794 RepID=UPI002AD34D98|nr:MULTISPECIES: PadR family transcriptional regulator [unclassified Microbacterium]MDZ8171097.1 PadR family transcriptional regulator [Microbacterium sp. KSW-48]MDZ8201614.1 PadR family transcriptional regulator [Microbacterium sp. SSW1-59]
MSVRRSLLAILDQGPCYGYQLRAEFDRRTGSTWPLNVGQIYNTLDRLERDGLVTKGPPDEQGHVYWSITAAGSDDVAEWLSSPVERAPQTRDELAVKLAVAATLPGIEVADVIRTQRRASLARVESLRSSVDAAGPPDGPETLARSLVLDAMLHAAQAEVDWLDRSAEHLAQHPEPDRSMSLSGERPKRGRPFKTRTTG